MKTKKAVAFVLVALLVMSVFMSVSFASNPDDFVIENGVLTGYTGTDTVIMIPDTVTSIGDRALMGLTGITSITIPSSVTNIGLDVFDNCSGLTEIIVDNSNLYYSSLDGVLYNVTKTTLVTCPAGKTGDFVIQDFVTDIGRSAFWSCTKLTSIIIPNGVTSIGDSAFYFCVGLTTVTIGSGVTGIGDYAFDDCSCLTQIVVSDSSLSYSSQDDALFNKNKTTLIQYPAGKTGVYVIADTVTSIGNGAFNNCGKLSSITIGSGVTSIGEYAFWLCTGLTGIVIPNSVTSIGDSAFVECYNLINANIGSGTTSIGNGAFDNCNGLTQLIVDSSNPSYASPDGVLFDKAVTTIIQFPIGKTGEYTIPSTMTTINEFAFEHCYRLTNITIPDSVTTIGNLSFSYCNGLTSITIPASVTSISDYAFHDCIKLSAAVFMGNAPTANSTIFNNCSTIFEVYYINGNTGFANPWNGYTTTTDTYVPLTFPDTIAHWGETYINDLVSMGVITGYEVSPGVFEFRPDNAILRQEFAKIITVAYDIYNPSATSAFTDCPADAWFTPYVGSLEVEGLTNGKGDGTFGVGENISRQDTATLLSRVMIHNLAIVLPDLASAESTLSTFVDASDTADYAKPAVAFFINEKIISGYEIAEGSGTFEFRPRANITRAEVSKIIVNAIELFVNP
jgi:hypothetical protein